MKWADLRQRAVEAKEQMDNGPREWPGRPSRQRLDLFLAASPEVILELLDERDALERRLEAEQNHVWVPVREMPGHVIRQIP